MKLQELKEVHKEVARTLYHHCSQPIWVVMQAAYTLTPEEIKDIRATEPTGKERDNFLKRASELNRYLIDGKLQSLNEKID